MRHLVVIRIKNTEFDYTKYGLNNNFFSLDVSTSFSYSQNVGVTQYALLDGTTRVDNISREPASLTLQGTLGSVRGGGDSIQNFVQDTTTKSRLQNQMDLLKALRDQAIFLDFITDEFTYRNYLITGLSFGKNKLDTIDAQITIREIITFGDEINVEQTNYNTQLSDYEQDLILETWGMKAINSDVQLVDEVFRLITASTFSTPFIITFGNTEITPDVVLPTYRFRKTTPTTAPGSTPGSSIEVSDTNKMLTFISGGEFISGVVAGGNYLHLTLPAVSNGYNLYRTRLTRTSDGMIQEQNISNTYLQLRLLNDANTIYSSSKGEVLRSPSYNDVANGIHYLNNTGVESQYITEMRFGLCFIRKLKNNKYVYLPNLLGNDSRGYLYSATYEKSIGSDTVLYPSLVYIHPSAWKRIKSEVSRVWNESTYFKTKELR